MPTLFRLLIVVGVLAGLAYGAMLAVTTLLAPQPHDISDTITLPTPAKEGPAK